MPTQAQPNAITRPMLKDKDACPCQSGADYSNCCQGIIQHNRIAETPEQLMRSRYTAYVLADLAYIKATTHPDVRQRYDFENLRQWAEQSEWLGLQVHGTQTDQLRGRVQFTARYRDKSGIIHHSEDSEFIQEEGRWYFLHGKDFTPPRKQEVGRNDPCFCGSGKKYKKCCMR